MTRAQLLRARRRVHHYDTPAQILHELQRIGSRYFWPALSRRMRPTWPHDTDHTHEARDAWTAHNALARRQLLLDGCASAALWDMGRAILLRACEIAREARRP